MSLASGFAIVYLACAKPRQGTLHVKAEVDDISVLDPIVLAFQPPLPGVFGPLLAPVSDEVLVRDHFGRRVAEEVDRRPRPVATDALRDRGIGRIVERLEESGELDDTLILFTSDNGACYEWGPFGFDGRSRLGETTLHKGDGLRKIGTIVALLPGLDDWTKSDNGAASAL